MNTQTTKLSAPSIVCGGCANAIKKALGDVQGISEVSVDTTSKTVTINHDERVPHEKIVSVLERAGFPAS